MTPEVGSKVKTFFSLKEVMSHIKLKGIEHRAPCKHIFCPHTRPLPLGLIKRFKKAECGHVAYQTKLKEVDTNIDANTLTLQTPPDL